MELGTAVELDVRVAQVELEALAVPEDLVVPAVLAALEEPEGPVVPAVRAALVVLANPVASVALVNREALAELVNQVAPAELEPVLVAVRVRTRSVIAAHHRDQVLVPRVEDLRAAAETMHAPAAAEAEKAWAAAVTAVEVVDVEAAG